MPEHELTFGQQLLEQGVSAREGSVLLKRDAKQGRTGFCPASINVHLVSGKWHAASGVPSLLLPA